MLEEGSRRERRIGRATKEDDLTLSLLYIHPHKIPPTRKEKVSILISRYTEYSRLGLREKFFLVEERKNRISSWNKYNSF